MIGSDSDDRSKIYFGDATNSVNRLDVKLVDEGKIRNDSETLSEAAGWVSHTEMGKIREAV